jgi:hypothetical protein
MNNNWQITLDQDFFDRLERAMCEKAVSWKDHEEYVRSLIERSSNGNDGLILILTELMDSAHKADLCTRWLRDQIVAKRLLNAGILKIPKPWYKKIFNRG